MVELLEIPKLRVAVDEQEKIPWDLGPLVEHVGMTLDFADYAVLDVPRQMPPLERKSVDDWAQSITVNHDRFFRELDRAEKARTTIITLIEGTLDQVIAASYRCGSTPKAVRGGTLSTVARGFPVYYCGTRDAAIDVARKILFRQYRLATRIDLLKMHEEREARLRQLGSVPTTA